jgi:hypothetical protein
MRKEIKVCEWNISTDFPRLPKMLIDQISSLLDNISAQQLVSAYLLPQPPSLTSPHYKAIFP